MSDELHLELLRCIDSMHADDERELLAATNFIISALMMFAGVLVSILPFGHWLLGAFFWLLLAFELMCRHVPQLRRIREASGSSVFIIPSFVLTVIGFTVTNLVIAYPHGHWVQTAGMSAANGATAVASKSACARSYIRRLMNNYTAFINLLLDVPTALVSYYILRRNSKFK